ncbi:hypothetical protein COO59_12290 [Mixta theicola]|uniref:ABC transporter substrate-binding protein n=1 Tax=Mixta theicola TaxID=1458355 RepID=A0A2K1Q8P1_9GAMM|nr:DUF1007 family protein [Mixta theicola]PNS11401.1 hypothetical protein COO59_12290 [Mixta theicola]GLR10446.1 membrane protein [Mixta theicola]
MTATYPINRAGIGCLALLFSPLAWSHPHSFIAMQTTPVVSNDALTGLKMVWTMDEITSADLLYDAGNAMPDTPVWKKLAAEVMANVLAQHYFTEFWHQGNAVKFENLPPSYSLARSGAQAVLTFVLPLAQPQPLKGQTYTFSSFDPTYFVDMTYKNAQALSLPDTLTSRCKLTLQTPKPDAALKNFAQALDKADAPPESMDLGRQFAQTVTLSCQ